jgi:hypothetical protein
MTSDANDGLVVVWGMADTRFRSRLPQYVSCHCLAVRDEGTYRAHVRRDSLLGDVAAITLVSVLSSVDRSTDV